MTRRRRRLLTRLAVLALLGVLALPSRHWRPTGWWRAEPFYRGRPASFYAANIQRQARWGPDGRLMVRTESPNEVWVRSHLSRALADLVWGRNDAAPGIG